MTYRGPLENMFLDELTPAERCGHVAIRILRGEQLTPRVIVRDYGVSRNGAYFALRTARRVVELASSPPDDDATN